MRLLLTLSLCLFCLSPAWAGLEIFACEPEWAALARELSLPDAEIFSATTGLQDPHRIQARPALIARLRRADLLVCTGAELEVGWLPLLLRRAHNPRVQSGKPGNLEAARYVRLRGIPQRLDRAEGDIHASGNPHIQTDPRNILRVAREMAKRLSTIDPSHARIQRPPGGLQPALEGGHEALEAPGSCLARGKGGGLPGGCTCCTG